MGAVGGPHLRGTWSGCRALSSPRHSPAERRRRSWGRRGLVCPLGLQSSTSGTSAGETAMSGSGTGNGDAGMRGGGFLPAR